MPLKEDLKKWGNFIDFQELNKVIHKIGNIAKYKSITPAYTDIFNAFKICDLNNLKVVFISQDPYPQKGVATGVAFANKEGVINISPSLNALKEAIIDYTVPHNNIIFDNTLNSWGKQGILLLNSALTTELNNPGSHTLLWKRLISILLHRLSISYPGLIYVLWGKEAQTFIPYIHNANIVYKMKHPAYYVRNNIKIPHSFFIELNNRIYNYYGEYVEWYKEQ